MVTARLICVFVFVYAKSRFSEDAAHIQQSGLGAYLVSNFHGSFLMGFGITYFQFSKFIVHMSLHANTSLNLRFRTDLYSKAKYQNLEGTIIS